MYIFVTVVEVAVHVALVVGFDGFDHDTIRQPARQVMLLADHATKQTMRAVRERWDSYTTYHIVPLTFTSHTSVEYFNAQK